MPRECWMMGAPVRATERCQGRRHTYLEGRRLFPCRGGHAQTSLTARTVLHGTRTPLRKWFLARFFFARHKQSISALLVAVERREASAGALALQVVPDGSWDSLGPELRGVIEGENTTVHTDDWSGSLPLAQSGVRHRPRTQGAPERAAAILPWAHIVASNLKAWLLGTFRGANPRHLQRYLDEFIYRFNPEGHRREALLLSRPPRRRRRPAAVPPTDGGGSRICTSKNSVCMR